MQVTRESFKQHAFDILDYWLPDVDFENGGVFYNREFMERSADRTAGEKNILMHMRQIYDFSVGHTLGYPEGERVARHLFETRDAVFEKKGELYLSTFFSWPPGREKWAEFRGYFCYDHLYIVIGLCKYAEVFKNEAAFLQAWEMLHKIRNYFAIEANPANGLYTYAIEGKYPPHQITGNAQLHHYEALIQLLRAAQALYTADTLQNYRSAIGAMIGEINDRFFTHYFNESLLGTPEYFNDDFTLSSRPMHRFHSVVHLLEWLGFFYEAQQLQVAPDSILSRAEELGRISFERCLRDNGAFCTDFFPEFNTTRPLVVFFAQVEAILAALLLQRLTGDTSYGEKAEKMTGFFSEFLVDKQYGGIYTSIFDSGIPMRLTKGHAYKCDHHNIRMVEKSLEYNLLPR